MKTNLFKQFAHTNEITDGDDPSWELIDKKSLPREAYAAMGDEEDAKTWLYPHHYISIASGNDVHGKPSHGKMVIHKEQMLKAYKQALKDKAAATVIEHFDAHWRAVDPDKDGTYLKPEVGSSQPYQKAEAPAYAFRHVAPFQLATGEAEGGGKLLSIVALCGRPLQHPKWGKIVQDLSGMIHKERILVDYNHEAGQLLGYIDKFDVSKDELKLSGAIIPQLTHKRSEEVSGNMAAGMPYEASIFFAPAMPDDIEVEDLADGVSDVVNGEVVTGPIRIFRRWPLRGVAVCPYGLDSQTTAFAQSSDEQSTVQFTVKKKGIETMKMAEKLAAIHKLFGSEPSVKDEELAALLAEEVEADEADEKKEDEKPVVPAVESEEDEAAKARQAAPFTKDDLKKFAQAFGNEAAAQFILDEKSFEQASIEFAQKMRAEMAELKAASKVGKKSESVKFDSESGKQSDGLPPVEKAKLDRYAKQFGLSADRAADLAKRRAEYEQKIQEIEQ